ncbi:hypothetical protein Phi39:1_gp40 [Cellulophaga phage phi39:1]|uniref:hypothetical protein n=1 Tax=Cellulophaga phage phi39:1 TaxID=1327993 RepID=UPI000351D0EF|nr:hypothetical protein Phi39:1_gp40 [Cellulophaga phage phi39:1]AGO49155.1 hypothetical protein Phi39:1_gp40 [Cellulophaga phage phi39:1]
MTKNIILVIVLFSVVSSYNLSKYSDGILHWKSFIPLFFYCFLLSVFVVVFFKILVKLCKSILNGI